jgi:hypothetical protein
MHRQLDRQLLGALGARGGSAAPGELREITQVPARTLARHLGRLDEAGLLAERSNGAVTLSPAGWQALYQSGPPRP